MKVTVFGANGRLGRLVVPLLVSAGHDVTAVVRRDDQLAAVAAGARGALGDVEGGPHGDLTPVLAGADAVVWTTGASHADPPGHGERIRDGGLRAIAAAAQSGVDRWVQVSSLYANRWQTGPEPMRRTLQNKYAMDEAVEASGLRWTVVRPGGLTDEPATGRVRLAEELPAGRVTRADVAAVVVALLEQGAGVGTGFDLVAGEDPVTVAVAALRGA